MRERNIRQIKLFGPVAMRHALDALTYQRDGYGLLDRLDDETVEQIARKLLTDARRDDRRNRANRSMRAMRAAIAAE